MPRRLAKCAMTLWALGCAEPTPPEPPPAAPRPNVKVTIEGDSAVMSFPGATRVAVRIADTLGKVYLVGDSLTKSYQTTGPFTAVVDVSSKNYYRNLSVAATGTGVGSLTVTAQGVADTIPLRAEAVSFAIVAVAEGFACGVSLANRTWCWGDNGWGQLAAPTPGDCIGHACQYGGGERAGTPIPARIGQTFAGVSTGGVICNVSMMMPAVCGDSCALTSAGEAFCWGFGGSAPSAIVLPSKPVKAVVTPGFPSLAYPRRCFLLDDASIYCLAQRVGNEIRPQGPIGGAFQYSAFDVGRYHACGLRTDGDIYCWGSNARGNLGLGTMDTGAHPDPERVTAPEKFVDVQVGDYATCGLSAGGKLYCWGVGYSATGVSPPPSCAGVSALCQTTPRLLEGGGTYLQFSMSATKNTVCGLKSAGDVDCWSTTSYNAVPANVSVGQPLQSISVGSPDSNGYFSAFACGISTTNVLWCWGSTGAAWKVGQ